MNKCKYYINNLIIILICSLLLTACSTSKHGRTKLKVKSSHDCGGFNKRPQKYNGSKVFW